MSQPAPSHSQHGIGRYIAIWAALLVMLFASIALGQIHNHYLMNTLVFTVAAIKATLVALFFMHLKAEPWIIVVLMIVGVLLLAVFFAGVSPDVTFNHTVPPTPL